MWFFFWSYNVDINTAQKRKWIKRIGFNGARFIINIKLFYQIKNYRLAYLKTKQFKIEVNPAFYYKAKVRKEKSFEQTAFLAVVNNTIEARNEFTKQNSEYFSYSETDALDQIDCFFRVDPKVLLVCGTIAGYRSGWYAGDRIFVVWYHIHFSYLNIFEPCFFILKVIQTSNDTSFLICISCKNTQSTYARKVSEQLLWAYWGNTHRLYWN